MTPLPTRTAALVTTLLSAAALGGALASERWLGLVPCALCLLERWPYRIAIVLGLVTLLWPRRLPLWPMAIVLAAGFGLGVTHVGVEQGWWPSPLPECAAPDLGHGSAAERLARMPLLPAKPCDEPTYLVPGVPVSMAAANMLLSLALTLSLVAAALGKEKPSPADGRGLGTGALRAGRREDAG